MPTCALVVCNQNETSPLSWRETVSQPVCQNGTSILKSQTFGYRFDCRNMYKKMSWWTSVLLKLYAFLSFSPTSKLSNVPMTHIPVYLNYHSYLTMSMLYSQSQVTLYAADYASSISPCQHIQVKMKIKQYPVVARLWFVLLGFCFPLFAFLFLWNKQGGIVKLLAWGFILYY